MDGKGIRVREDGYMDSVNGPLVTRATRESIAGAMGWQDSGWAADAISRTLDLLADGKAVRLVSSLGINTFQPLLDDDDGRKIPAGAAEVYSPDGEIVEGVGTDR